MSSVAVNANGTAKKALEFPDYRRSVALKYVKRGYTFLMSYLLTIALVPLGGMLLLELLNMHRNGELSRLMSVAKQTDLTFNLITVVATISALVAVTVSYYVLRTRPVYLVDFQVYRAPDSWMATYARFMAGSRGCQRFTDEALEFQEKILQRSGLGQETYLPPAVQVMPPDCSMANARKEFEMVVFPIVEELLQRTGVHPKQIAILVVNCSLFNPTPSLAAMIINKYKMRSNILSYNLAGMGCSASPISIDLAKQLLQLHPSSYALVVSTENITQNWYFGNDRDKLLPNCLFRVGGGAILLSNRRRDAWRAKYELMHTVRTHLGAKDAAYSCIFQMEDEERNIGVRLTKELFAVAGEALKINVTTLGPLVLPLSEQLLFFFNLVARKVFGYRGKPYIPDFKLAFDKVCIHTGGRAVIDEIEKQLQLSNEMVEPSRAALYRYGNVSSSSIWYVLAYLESFQGMRRGDRIWQMGFGSGFKCNSAVWRANRTFKHCHQAWEGFDLQEMRQHLQMLKDLSRQAKKA
ncbi:hypothetical protein VOLCADRAFT_109539 [Volvox carteri f. nagariensis]|uniref:3-ketoacyl-CoA synthase n=1 Tax=Volvox carteri f. nagariensis TaxID=3068 RepID=D8THF4_VOLCA|nr:uncharacterized protein VOLCADRAFT_109539 [Volvox carteri f. nagariensis]EFJ53061.1 hypothetical protein VOLCADRAFT_109539 [Volvox carteri f. nagariensis]|eukprot:XP_002946066.1 hypothetical protein VOLCADRAFT_109539 [Volvox carteri f. nagariensis]